MVDDWNRLSQQVVRAKTIESFKRRFDDFMDEDERWVMVIREDRMNRNYLVQASGFFVASLYSYVLMKKLIRNIVWVRTISRMSFFAMLVYLMKSPGGL